MKNVFKSIFWINIFVIGFAYPVSSWAKQECKPKCKNQIKHNIQLQLSDSLGFPVPDTECWVTLDIRKEGSIVTILIPSINFVTGQPAGNVIEPLPLVPGGYLYTANGFLPEEFRPTDLVPPSIVAASNNGLSPVFSFNQDPTTLPNPPAGYIVQVTNAGELQIQCAGTFGNIIPPGPQIVMPCSITYAVKSKKILCENITLSTGPTNITQFVYPWIDAGFRDHHVNDAYDDVVAYAWTDNSMVVDKTNGTMNLMVVVGKIKQDGALKVGNPVQLTDFLRGMAWDTAVAINRVRSKEYYSLIWL